MDEIREILNALGTQIDGVEAYLRQLNEIGYRPEFFTSELGRVLRVRSDVAMDMFLSFVREDVQIIEDTLDKTVS